MTELETAIRDALHSRADAIEPRETALRTRRPRRWLPPTIAAAVVAVLALAIGLVVARQNSPSTPAASRRPGFVGYRWKLVAVDDVYGHLVVPRRITATIAFGRDGSFQLDDTVNFYSGRYRLAQGGYTPGRIGGTLVGFAGSRRSVIGRVVAAMASAMYVFQGGPVVRHPGPYVVPVRVRGTVMSLGTGRLRMTFVRAGPFAGEPARGTPTASRAPSSGR